MNVPIAFISSTVEDLRPYRQAAREAALRCEFLPRMMEYFTARDNPPLAECLEQVGGADVLVVIVAYRFGWVPKEQGGRLANRKSITWLECEQALKDGKKVLAFVVDEDYPWPAELREEYRIAAAAAEGTANAELMKEVQRNVARLRDFRETICNDRFIAKFTTPDTLALEVERALRDWRDRHPELGIRETSVPDEPCDPSRYLAALDEDTAWINIQGLVVGSGHAHRFPIDDLYIPLTTSHAVSSSEDSRVARRSDSDRQRLEGRRVELDEAIASRRLVVIGDPGAGKTTFLRRIAHLLCQVRRDPGRATLSETKLGLDDQPLPLLVRIWDLVEYVRTSRQRQVGPIAADAASWLIDYLAAECKHNRNGLNVEFLEKQLADGSAMVLFDGLDEASSDALRENVASLITNAARAYDKCRFVVTSRPGAYHGQAVLEGFDQVQIERLDDTAIETFLTRWYAALFPESERLAKRHCDQLLDALRERPEIHRLARNPVMLTALGVVHWNERRLPEQRADLYDSIITWLSRSRKMRSGRPAPEETVNLLQELALGLQTDRAGRQVQVSRHGAARLIAPECRGVPEQDRAIWAEKFLAQEELDSGIVVRRGDDLRFWHLTFQEYLAARAISSRPDSEQRRLLLTHAGSKQELRIYDSDWREMVLLLGGVLFHQGPRRVDGMFATVLDHLDSITDATLADKARCAALLGSTVQDLTPAGYRPSDPRYAKLMADVFAIFDAERSADVPIATAIEAAEALGQAGDPRFIGAKREENWIAIPAGEFLMGVQTDNPDKPNFDERWKDLGDNEWEQPVHRVELSDYQIARYPLTVTEFARFVEQGGYLEECWWSAGGFSQWQSPDDWEEQLEHPNRPVVNISWFEAAAFAAWAGCRLPTEAEWERAARGTEGRRYPWGNADPDDRRLNYSESKIGSATPVGLFPRSATPEGIEDMAGNVWEWCLDWADKGYYSVSPSKDPRGPAAGSSRVLRGGAWNDYALNCCSAFRGSGGPVSRDSSFGFRLVRVV